IGPWRWRRWPTRARTRASPAWRPRASRNAKLCLQCLELVDHRRDNAQAAVPEGAPGGVEAEARQELGIRFRPAGLEHRQILVDETRMALAIEGVKRVHEAIAEGIGVDVKGRMHEVRNVGPIVFVALFQLDGRPEALGLYLHPQLPQALGREFACAALLVHLA